MFTKYFGLLLIVGGIMGSFVQLFYNGFYIDIDTGSIKTDPELLLNILISAVIISVTFFIGRYLYKAGKAEKTSSNLKINKLVKISVILFVVSILIIPQTFFIIFFTEEGRSWGDISWRGISWGDSWGMMYVFAFGVLPAMIMSGVALILLIIHWLKNRGLK